MGCAQATPEQDCRDANVSIARPYRKLPPEAQEQARAYWREKGWTWDGFDSERLTEFFQDELAERYGIEGAVAQWSLGYCQADGVSFTAKPEMEVMAEHDERLQQYLRAAEVVLAMQDAEYGPEWTIEITHPGRCYGWDGMQLNVECRGPWGSIDPIQDTLDGLAALAAEVICDIVAGACKRLERLGYDEIEYHESDEYFDDLLMNNDQYLFDEDGEYVE
jgi:hypothetical protein